MSEPGVRLPSMHAIELRRQRRGKPAARRERRHHHHRTINP
jgi:hypothetical protein